MRTTADLKKALSLRLRKARFEENKTLADFDLTYNPKIPAPLIRDLATCGYLDRKESVLLYGPVGVGKSHIAQALGHAACMKGYSVLYTKTNRLLQDLGGGHADGTFDVRLRKYILVDLLIVDDFGMKELSSQQAEDLYELISERYRAGSMIVVSNRAPKDWYALFPNPVYAEGALDRLINSSHQVFMPGKATAPCTGRTTTRTAIQARGLPKEVKRTHNLALKASRCVTRTGELSGAPRVN